MAKEAKPNVSKHLLDKAAFEFLRHPDQLYTRAEIENLLGVSKPTACRVIAELSRQLSLKEEKEGQTIYYSLSSEDANSIYKTLDFVIAVNDKERLALNFLLNMAGASDIFGTSISTLREKLDKACLLSYRPMSISEVAGTPQIVNGDNIETIISALETRTIISLDYHAAYSDCVKTHEIYPIGMFLKDGNLYLYAYDPKHQNATTYAYSRIKSIDYLYDKHYTIPDGISMANVINDPFGIGFDKPQRVVVYIYNKQVFFEKEKKWQQDTIITDNADGSIRMELTIADYSAFKRWALSLGADIYVESPKVFSDWIKSELESALRRYR